MQKKSLDMLIGLCLGLTSDGRIASGEVQFLLDWLRDSDLVAHDNNAQDLTSTVEKVMAEGVFTATQARKILNASRDFIAKSGYAIPAKAQALPVYSIEKTPQVLNAHNGIDIIPPDQSIFDSNAIMRRGCAYCFTGDFVFGSRKDCERQTEAKGGYIQGKMKKSFEGYLVVGSIPSKDWAFGNYGRKIEEALALRKRWGNVYIVHEDVWAASLQGDWPDSEDE